MRITDEAVKAALLAVADTGKGTHRSERIVRKILNAALPHLSQGAVSAPLHDALQRWRDEDHEETIALSREQVIEVCEEFRALSPAPVGVTDTDAELIAALRSEIPFALFNGTEADWDEAERKLQAAADRFEALASHEPAPTDTQEGLSEAGEVPLAGINQLHIDNWTDDDFRQHIPAVRAALTDAISRQSALTARQQEVETIREGIKEIAEREQSIRDNWDRYEESTKARILELEADLEIANDKLRKMVKALASVTHQLRGWQPEEVAVDSDLMEDAPAIERALRVLGRAER